MNTSSEDGNVSVASGHEPAAEQQELLTANVSVVSLYEPDERVTDPRTKIRGLVPGLVTMIVAVLILILTPLHVKDVANTPLGPRFWPDMIGWAMVGLAAVLLITFFVRGLRWGEVPAPVTGWGVSRLLATLAVLTAYLIMWDYLQFWVSTLIVVLLLIVLYGARGWKALIFFPIGITALLHFLFVVALKVPL